MKISVVGQDCTPDAALTEWITKRFERLASRFGPIESASVLIIRYGKIGGDTWAVEASVTAFETTTTGRYDHDRDLEDAFDRLFVHLAAQMRRARWAREGVPQRCRWCEGDEFLHVIHPPSVENQLHLYAEPRTGESRGLLEALMCRGCGHVEWFASDPGRISVKVPGVAIVKARSTDPFRG